MRFKDILLQMVSHVKPVDKGTQLSFGQMSEEDKVTLEQCLKENQEVTISSADRIEFDESVVRYTVKSFPEGFQIINIARVGEEAVYSLKCRKTKEIIKVPADLFKLLFEKQPHE